MADWQSWPQVLTFDREVRRYRAQNADDMAAMTCVERWGGWLTTDVEVADEYSTANESAELQVSIAGGHYAPPQRIFTATYIEFVEPADTGAN